MVYSASVYFPVMLRVKGEPCLVVGGGRVALQKVRSLLRAGADVTVVGPDALPSLQRLKVRRIPRRFRAGDVSGRVLVVAATDDPEVNRAVTRACRRRSIPVNVVDVPELCSFIVPSVLRRGPVTIAVSTGGASPSLAKALRKRIGALLPASLGRTATRVAAERRRLMRALPPSPSRSRRIKALVRSLGPGRTGGR